MGILLIDGFHELTNDEWHTLYSLDLLLGPDKLALKTPDGNGNQRHPERDIVERIHLCSSLIYSSCNLMYLGTGQL